MRLTWFLTVFSARNKRAAISPLVCPPAISDMTSISRADRPRLVCSSTCARLMRPPVKSVRDTQAPARHDVKTYLYRYRYTKTALLKPPRTEQALPPAPSCVGLASPEVLVSRASCRSAVPQGLACPPSGR